jgi:hypothetical protein
MMPMRHSSYPPELSWRANIQPYVKSKGIFQCPSNPTKDLPDLATDGENASYAVACYDGGSGGRFRDGTSGPTPHQLPLIIRHGKTLGDAARHPLFLAAPSKGADFCLVSRMYFCYNPSLIPFVRRWGEGTGKTGGADPRGQGT